MRGVKYAVKSVSGNDVSQACGPMGLGDFPVASSTGKNTELEYPRSIKHANAVVTMPPEAGVIKSWVKKRERATGKSPEPAGWKARATWRRHSCLRVPGTFLSPVSNELPPTFNHARMWSNRNMHGYCPRWKRSLSYCWSNRSRCGWSSRFHPDNAASLLSENKKTKAHASTWPSQKPTFRLPE